MTTRRVNDMPTSYSEAALILDGKDFRTIANNTWLHRGDDGTIQLGLHSTAIVEWDLAGYITLHTGGWRSVTTKARMNAVLRTNGYSVGSVKREWMIFDHWTPDSDGNPTSYVYEDGDAWPTIHAGTNRTRRQSTQEGQ